MSNKGKLFILSAPAGTGKTSLMARLVKEVPNTVQSLSYTTRPPRKGEVEGAHYRFVTKKVFEEMIERGEFLEYVVLFGHYYGTSKKAIEERLNQGKNIILVIDTQGAMKLKGQIQATYIFVLPPSLDALKERLLKRRSECDDKIGERLRVAVEELKQKSAYDYEVVNDDFEQALLELKEIITGA